MNISSLPKVKYLYVHCSQFSTSGTLAFIRATGRFNPHLTRYLVSMRSFSYFYWSWADKWSNCPSFSNDFFLMVDYLKRNEKSESFSNDGDDFVGEQTFIHPNNQPEYHLQAENSHLTKNASIRLGRDILAWLITESDIQNFSGSKS